MPIMKRKEQEVKDLRREVEILRAQVKSLSHNNETVFIPSNASSGSKGLSRHYSTANIEYSSQNLDILLDKTYIKSQLTKTIVLTIAAFAIIAGFYFMNFDNFIRLLNIQI